MLSIHISFGYNHIALNTRLEQINSFSIETYVIFIFIDFLVCWHYHFSETHKT
jgi:hypothetical protein